MLRLLIPVLSLVLLAACDVCGVSACIGKNDTADTATPLPEGCVEIVVECPYRFWTEADYNASTCEEPDAFVCFDGDLMGVPQQESCPDNDPTHPECGGRDAVVEERGSQVCAACSDLAGEVYYGHPVYTGKCGEECGGCDEQAEPPWVFIRAVVCE